MEKNIQFGIAWVAVLAATAGQVQGASITTFFASNNSGSSGGGIYFDINVLSPTGITIEKLFTNTDAIFTTGLINIYTRPGTYSGFETSSAGWTLVSSGTGTSAPLDTPSAFDITDFFLAQAVTGIAIESELGVWNHHYTNGNGLNQFYSNSDLSLTFGSANNLAFSGGIFSPRVWNGTIQYSVFVPPVLYLPLNSSGYWDINDAAPGAGGPTPNGSWQGTNWTTSLDGTVQTVLWTDGSDAHFSAGSDATGSFTVDLDASVIVRDLAVRSGHVTIHPTNFQNSVTLIDPRDGESAVSVANGGTLVFESTVIAPENLAKEGGGEVDFNGATTIGGTFSVNEGTAKVNNSLVTGSANNSGALVVNGSMESGSTDNSGVLMVNGTLTSPVNNSGFLGGAGVINGNVDNSGIISPGNSVGELTINGSYIHGSGATLLAEINPNGNSDSLNIRGRAVLNGGIVRTSLPRALYTDGFSWDILSAGGGVSGAFSSVQGLPDSETLELVLVNNNNSVDLRVQRTSYGSFGTTIGEQKIGVGLDKIVPMARNRGDAMENMLIAMDFGASGQQIEGVLKSLNPEMYTSFKSTAMQTAQHFTEKLGDRIVRIREAELLLGTAAADKIGVSGLEVVSEKGGVVKTAEEQTEEKTGMLPHDNSAANTELPTDSQQRKSKWLAWGQYENTNSDHNGGDKYLGYDSASNGVFAGMDGRLSSMFRAGFGFGAVGTNLDWERSGDSGDQTGILAGIYSSLEIEEYYIDTSISLGTYANDANRVNPLNGNLQSVSAEFNDISWMGRIGIGYDFRLGGNWVLGPTASLNYLNLRSDNFQEMGGDFLGMSFDEDTDETLISSLGGRVATHIGVWGVSFLPRFEISWKHDENGDKNTVHASFRDYQNLSIAVDGAGAGKDLLAANLGLVALMSETFSGNILLSGDFGDDYQSVVLSCGLTVIF